MPDKETARQCEEEVYSESYIDLIASYQGNPENIELQFGGNCVQTINAWQAVVYVPLSSDNDNLMEKYAYRAIPNCYGILDTSNIEAIGVLPLRRRPYINLYGRGVLMAFIDTGIDYTNPVFKNADNTSRILGIWDQTIRIGPSPPGIQYGTDYSNEMINEALQSEDPYSVVPTRDENGHGTFMAGIGAGNEMPEDDFTGIAPMAGILAVKLKPAKENIKRYYGIRQDAVCYQENDILLAIKYVMEKAIYYKRPIILCFGIGTNLGGHEGTSILGGTLSYLGNIWGIGIVTAAGNEANQRHHYFGQSLNKNEFEDVEIEIAEGERGLAVELWATIPQLYSVGFLSPGGEFTGRIPARLGKRDSYNFLLEQSRVYIHYEIVEGGTGDELIFMRFDRPVPGIWKIRVFNEMDIPGDFHLWMPMEGFISPNTFFIRSNPYTTICEQGNANRVITTGAYDHITTSMYSDSSRGNTRTGRIKPTIVAPGVNIYGPLPGGGYGVRTGTSIASAHCAGVCALLMEWGMVDGNTGTMNTLELERFLIKGAKKDNMIYPNREWGYGALDILGVFESLITS